MDKMKTNRVWTLAIMVVIGLSFVWVVPNSGELRKSRLASDLPAQLEGRESVELQISAKERKILTEDTTFSRRRYYYNMRNANAPIDVSVVFSGKDINNSIHRPEICLKAQGWNFESEKYITISVGEIEIPFKEIVCFRPRIKNEYLPHENSRGEIIVDRRVQYYTFVGSEKIVAGHYERTWEDIRLRVLKGTDQQWAYITFASSITDNPGDDTIRDLKYKIADLEETNTTLREFTSKAMRVFINPAINN